MTLLAAVAVNGTPVAQDLIVAPFDAQGVFQLNATVPAGLSGNVVTLLAFGFEPGGSIGTTNRETLTLQ